jgi:DNA-binding LacI/PurR family transcriptional regulator
MFGVIITMLVTMKDVARKANVSIATVSRVLNSQDKVKKKTREKIHNAMWCYLYFSSIIT